MPTFSIQSQEKLKTCCPELIKLCNQAVVLLDFTVIQGYRSNDEQDRLFESGASKLRGGKSKHNKWPSSAVDLAPYPIDWYNIERFERLALVMKALALANGVLLVWGGDWVNFRDYVHFQI